MAVTQKEKEIEGLNYKNQIQRIRDDYDRKLREAENKTTDNEEKSKEAERKLITIKAQYDKEKALLNQKVEHLTKQIDDYQKREKEMKQEINSQLKEQTIAYKDKVDKYEKNIKNLINENEKLKEQMVDLESTVEGLEADLNSEKIKSDEIIDKKIKKLKNWKKI